MGEVDPTPALELLSRDLNRSDLNGTDAAADAVPDADPSADPDADDPDADDPDADDPDADPEADPEAGPDPGSVDQIPTRPEWMGSAPLMGSRVLVHGLLRPDLNGRAGEVVGQVDGDGRIPVRLQVYSECGKDRGIGSIGCVGWANTCAAAGI